MMWDCQLHSLLLYKSTLLHQIPNLTLPHLPIFAMGLCQLLILS